MRMFYYFLKLKQLDKTEFLHNLKLKNKKRFVNNAIKEQIRDFSNKHSEFYVCFSYSISKVFKLLEKLKNFFVRNNSTSKAINWLLCKLSFNPDFISFEKMNQLFENCFNLILKW